MSWLLLLALAALTYGSRLLGLLAVPEVTGGLRDAVERVPAPLFGALAAAPLIVEGGLAAAPVLGAFGGAVAAVLLRRSLLAALLGGVVGWAFTLVLG